jgi:hypothetical protein
MGSFGKEACTPSSGNDVKMFQRVKLHSFWSAKILLQEYLQMYKTKTKENQQKGEIFSRVYDKKKQNVPQNKNFPLLQRYPTSNSTMNPIHSTDQQRVREKRDYQQKFTRQSFLKRSDLRAYFASVRTSTAKIHDLRYLHGGVCQIQKIFPGRWAFTTVRVPFGICFLNFR